MLLLYSDGVLESASEDGAYISESLINESIVEALREQSAHPARTAVDTLTQPFFSHAKPPVQDDITINAYWRVQK